MKTIVRVIKKSRPHFNTRRLVYMTFDGGKSEVSHEKHAKFVTAVEWWNEIFKIGYGDFRNAIEEICEDFNKNCKFDVTIKHVDAMHVLGDFDGWVFTADEDNFIDKELSVLLKNYDGPVSPVKWPVLRIGSNHKQVLWDKLIPNILPTGGYAFPTNDGIKKYEKLLNCHGDTSKCMDTFTEISTDTLGLVMVHPSSHGVLSKIESKENLKSVVDSFLKDSDSPNVKPKYRNHYLRIVKLYSEL